MHRSRFSLPRHWFEMSDQLRAKVALLSGKYSPLIQCAGRWWTKSWYGHRVEEKSLSRVIIHSKLDVKIGKFK
jgi:hypothetical protein